MKPKAGDRVVSATGVSGTVIRRILVPQYEVRWDQGYTTTVKGEDLKK